RRPHGRRTSDRAPGPDDLRPRRHAGRRGARGADRGRASRRRCGRRADRDVAVSWWSEADSTARRALAAGMIAWMLDAFDVMLFALVLPSLSADLGLSKAQGGLLGSVMLIAAAVGGVVMGRVAD